eukprot:COSAG02_NODE_5906_length_3944_cov_23.964878_2_plen_147_part_00
MALQGLRQKYGTMKDLDVHAWQKNEHGHVQVQRPGLDYEGRSLDRTGQDGENDNRPKHVYKYSRDRYSADHDREVKKEHIAKPSFDIEAVQPLQESFRAEVSHRPRAGTGSFVCLESKPEPEPDPEPTHETFTDANPLADTLSSDL